MRLIISFLFIGALLSGSTFASCPCHDTDTDAAPVETDKGPESDPSTSTEK